MTEHLLDVTCVQADTGKCSVCFSLLEQLDVAHDELLPVDEDHGHFLLRQQLALQQWFVKNLHTATQMLENSFSNQRRYFHVLT